jgi:serine/threonine protein kinase/regulation of enolase protein 1 (concanavalin A-like superfamily)
MPQRIGRFEVRAVLGAGGMGTVFRAWDPQLEREVALKVPRQHILASSQQIERFLREARASARLRHPHIVPVYDAGFDGQHHYIAAAFIAGRSLAETLSEGRLECRRAAELVRGLAEALAHAHGQGIVHRDVKPANILLDEHHKPYLTDFGLALQQDASRRLTQLGAVLGTPAYMSPEQAGGLPGDVGPACDQYSLGAVLYELLTGQAPFSGPPQMVVLQVLQVAPPAPRQVNPAVPAALEAICLKAMARRPEQRYPTCQELADALGKWLVEAAAGAGQAKQATAQLPIQSARPPSGGMRKVKATGQPRRGTGPAPKQLKPRPGGNRWALAAAVAVLGLSTLALVLLLPNWLSSPRMDRPESTQTNLASSSEKEKRENPQTPPAPSPKEEKPKSTEVSPPKDPPGEKTSNKDDKPAKKVGQTRRIERWGDFFDRDGDCTVRTDQEGVTITVPGKPHVLGPGMGNTPRVLREVSGDFTATVLAVGPFQPGTIEDSTLRPDWTAMHIAGLVLWVNDSTFVRVQCGVRYVVKKARAEPFAEFMPTVNGSLVQSTDVVLDDAPPLLKLERRGDHVFGAWKQGNGNWTSQASVQIPGLPEKTRVGLFAISTSRRELKARLEGFQVKAGPAEKPGLPPPPPRKPGPQIQGWGEFFDPDGDCKYRLQGGKLMITVPGKGHDLMAEVGRMNAPAVMRNVSGDFIVTVTASGPLHPGPLSSLRDRPPYQAAGLFLYVGHDTYIRLERASMFQGGKDDRRASFHVRGGGQLLHLKAIALNDQPATLRLSRRAGRVWGDVSLDGAAWTSLGSAVVALPDRVAIGVAAVNTSMAPLHAWLEAFQITSLPAGEAGKGPGPPGPGPNP